jgi:hypothetical protein
MDAVDRADGGVEHATKVALLRAEGAAGGDVEVDEAGRGLVVGELGVGEVDEAGEQLGVGPWRGRVAVVEGAREDRLAGLERDVAVALGEVGGEVGGGSAGRGSCRRRAGGWARAGCRW